FALDEMKSVYVKDGSCKWTPPGRVRVFEIYRDADAYKAHIQTPHFKKFRATTDHGHVPKTCRHRPDFTRCEGEVRTIGTRSKQEVLQMELKRNGSQPSAGGPAEYFTGTVRIDPLFKAPGPARTSGAYVTFEPCSRSNWH